MISGFYRLPQKKDPKPQEQKSKQQSSNNQTSKNQAYINLLAKVQEVSFEHFYLKLSNHKPLTADMPLALDEWRRKIFAACPALKNGEDSTILQAVFKFYQRHNPTTTRYLDLPLGSQDCPIVSNEFHNLLMTFVLKFLLTHKRDAAVQEYEYFYKFAVRASLWVETFCDSNPPMEVPTYLTYLFGIGMVNLIQATYPHMRDYATQIASGALKSDLFKGNEEWLLQIPNTHLDLIQSHVLEPLEFDTSQVEHSYAQAIESLRHDQALRQYVSQAKQWSPERYEQQINDLLQSRVFNNQTVGNLEEAIKALHLDARVQIFGTQGNQPGREPGGLRHKLFMTMIDDIFAHYNSSVLNLTGKNLVIDLSRNQYWQTEHPYLNKVCRQDAVDALKDKASDEEIVAFFRHILQALRHILGGKLELEEETLSRLLANILDLTEWKFNQGQVLDRLMKEHCNLYFRAISKKHEQVDEVTQPLCQHEKQLAQLQTEIEHLAGKKVELESALAAKSEEMSASLIQQVELDQSLKQANQTIERLQQSLKSLKSQKSQTPKGGNQNQMKLQAAEITRLGQVIHEKTEALNHSQARVETLKAKLDEAHQLNNELEVSQQSQLATNKKVNQTLTDLQVEYRRSEDTVLNQTAIIEALKSQLAQSQKHFVEQSQLRTYLKQANEQVHHLQQNNQTLQQMVSEYDQVFDEMEREKLVLASETKRLQETNAKLIGNKAQLSKNLKQLTEENTQLHHQLQALSANKKQQQGYQSSYQISQELISSKEQIYQKLAEDEQKLAKPYAIMVPESYQEAYGIAQRVLDEIEQQQGQRAFIDGGFVRDMLAAKEPNDIDIVTTCPVSWVKENHLKIAGIEFTPKETNSAMFTGVIPTEARKIKVDLTCDPNLDLVDEMNHRDFTCNMLFLNRKGQIIDLSRQGLKDIEDQNIIAIKPLQAVLKDDPSRMLRMIRLSLALDWSLAAEQKQVLIDLMPSFHHMPIGIFNYNMRRLFEVKNPVRAFEFLEQNRLLKPIFGLKSGSNWQLWSDFCKDVLSNPIMYQDHAYPYLYVTALCLLKAVEDNPSYSTKEVAENFVRKFAPDHNVSETYYQKQADRLEKYMRFYQQKYHDFNRLQNQTHASKSETNSFEHVLNADTALIYAGPNRPRPATGSRQQNQENRARDRRPTAYN